MADYNQALTVAEALQRGRALDGKGSPGSKSRFVTTITSAMRPSYASWRRQSRLERTSTGRTRWPTPIAAHACDYAMPDFARIGGVSGWLEAAALAQAAGVEMSSHLYPEFSAHLLAATPTCHWLEYVDWRPRFSSTHRDTGVSHHSQRPVRDSDE
jgi:mandelate racemase